MAMAGGCKSKTEPLPKPAVVAATEPFDSESDIFSRSHGYWEWVRSTGLNFRATPASVGFTRQLTFKGDSMVYIFHDQKPEMHPQYHLHAGPSRCSSNSRPLVDFDAEPQIRNNRIRVYTITRTSIDTTITITGEMECTDGGNFEKYQWHRRR
jgi:hypothetical protein